MKKIVLFLLTLTVAQTSLRAQLPTITQSPTNLVLPAGATLSLSVTANGGTPLAYQWFKDNRLLVGATNSAWTVANAGVTNSGMYSVVITNLSGMVISLPASVAVGNPCLFAWGDNFWGQLGIGTAFNSYTLPVCVASNVVTGTAGWQHSLFLTTDGTLWGTGESGVGELGNGTLGNHYTLPIKVVSNVVAMAAGSVHSLFVKTDGTLWTMGWNTAGQLGVGASTGNLYPTPVNVASNVVAVAAGSEYSLFLTRDGTLWGMGDNEFGQLGGGAPGGTNPPVIVVSNITIMASNVVMIAGGGYHSLFVTRDGRLWAMGYNDYGQLGNGAQVISNSPVNVASNVVAVAAGADHSLFLTMDGTLWGMGNNEFGQLGDGAPPLVGWPVNVAINVVAMAGGWHTLFVQTDGTLWAMGENIDGALGNGTENDTNRPTNVPQLIVANVFPVEVAYFSLALGSLEVLPPKVLPPQNFTAKISGAGLQLQLTGTANINYILQTATNLTPPIDWQSIVTNLADGDGNWSFTVTNLMHVPARFYRAAGP